ncbi:hypothetical protein TBLA_0A00885 [Henningerozyma blattae CBS 6284]|uniref:Uncharacterized protein n=1 Tax=Henningerozyma blattae (strain ATCC 34711 / CBS 6284 / DSM 70876 / NBRC 10599 / NRRL Y-10934 / UCD 77-7) TaxID=1071380 RepID=I2GUT7_HENB6|nr:hypothetical protein TBLA_0A00885 [Tetrapisispora blattae CBS 6284]CCH57889.1 hypothetical protein TBLA_0A00885 [Tetrapisispora blattae CBS 6284]
MQKNMKFPNFNDNCDIFNYKNIENFEGADNFIPQNRFKGSKRRQTIYGITTSKDQSSSGRTTVRSVYSIQYNNFNNTNEASISSTYNYLNYFPSNFSFSLNPNFNSSPERYNIEELANYSDAYSVNSSSSTMTIINFSDTSTLIDTECHNHNQDKDTTNSTESEVEIKSNIDLEKNLEKEEEEEEEEDYSNNNIKPQLGMLP